MKTLTALLLSLSLSLALALALAPAAAAQTLAERDTPLDRFAGHWIMTGVIDGQEVVHDVNAEWVLGGHYLFIHDRSRERDEDGAPAYEARVYIGWDEAGERLVCMWLDVTGGGGLVPDGFGYGRPEADRIPFVWGEGTVSQIHNTFSYQRQTDQWAWHIDNVREGVPENFARVVLARDTAEAASNGADAGAHSGLLRAIDRLSEATAPGGGGAEAYGAILAEDFSRRTLAGEQVQGRQDFIDGIHQWLEAGWRVASRESQMIYSTILGERAYTHRIVTETHTGPDGLRSGPATFALEETWQWIEGEWLLHRATVYPVSD